MIQNIIFDIGNVLTDFRWRDFLKDKGFEGEELERIAKASVESSVWSELDRGVWTFDQVMAGFVSNAPDLEEQLHRAYDDMTDIVTIRDYALDWVRELKKEGFHVYYLSNFSEKIERECKKALVFCDEMDGGILSHRDKVIKPGQEIYQLLMGRYGLKPWESVFIDDTAANIYTARKLGMYGIIFENPKQVKTELDEIIKNG